MLRPEYSLYQKLDDLTVLILLYSHLVSHAVTARSHKGVQSAHSGNRLSHMGGAEPSQGTQRTRLAAKAARAAAIAAQQPPDSAAMHSPHAPVSHSGSQQQPNLASRQQFPAGGESRCSSHELLLPEQQLLSSGQLQECKFQGSEQQSLSTEPADLPSIAESPQKDSPSSQQPKQQWLNSDLHEQYSLSCESAEQQKPSSEYAEQPLMPKHRMLSSEAAEQDQDEICAQLRAATMADDDGLSPLQQLLQLCGQDVSLPC